MLKLSKRKNLATFWRPEAISVDKGLASSENMFKTYNLEQFSKAFPAINPALVQGPLWARDSDIVKINTHTTVMDSRDRVIDKRTNLVVMVDDETIDVKDLRPITTEEIRTGFVVTEELMKMKLNETEVTSLYDDAAPAVVPPVASYVSAQI